MLAYGLGNDDSVFYIYKSNFLYTQSNSYLLTKNNI